MLGSRHAHASPSHSSSPPENWSGRTPAPERHCTCHCTFGDPVTGQAGQLPSQEKPAHSSYHCDRHACLHLPSQNMPCLCLLPLSRTGGGEGQAGQAGRTGSRPGTPHLPTFGSLSYYLPIPLCMLTCILSPMLFALHGVTFWEDMSAWLSL